MKNSSEAWRPKVGDLVEHVACHYRGRVLSVGSEEVHVSLEPVQVNEPGEQIWRIKAIRPVDLLPCTNEVLPPPNQETMDRAWEGAMTSIRASGEDPKEIIMQAARNVEGAPSDAEKCIMCGVADTRRDVFTAAGDERCSDRLTCSARRTAPRPNEAYPEHTCSAEAGTRSYMQCLACKRQGDDAAARASHRPDNPRNCSVCLATVDLRHDVDGAGALVCVDRDACIARRRAQVAAEKSQPSIVDRELGPGTADAWAERARKEGPFDPFARPDSARPERCGWCGVVDVVDGRCRECGAQLTAPGVWHIPRREREFDARYELATLRGAAIFGGIVALGEWARGRCSDSAGQSLWDEVQEEANALASYLGIGRTYHGAEKHSPDWHDGWECCAKPLEASLREILASHEPRLETAGQSDEMRTAQWQINRLRNAVRQVLARYEVVNNHEQDAELCKRLEALHVAYADRSEPPPRGGEP